MAKKKLEVNPDKAIKTLPLFYYLIFVVFGLLAMSVTGVIKTPQNDLLNATSLVIEVGFGIAITWTVYVYSKKWKVENDKMTKDIKKITEDLSQLTNDVRKTVAEESRIRKEIVFDMSYHLNGHLETVIMTLNHSLDMYENYKNNTNGKAEHWKSMFKISHDRAQYFIDYKMNLLDFMKIYGVRIARMYWRVLGDLQIASQLYGDLDERNIHEFASLVKQSLAGAEELKKVIEPLGTKEPD